MEWEERLKTNYLQKAIFFNYMEYRINLVSAKNNQGCFLIFQLI